MTYTYDGDGLRTLASTGNQANKKTQYDWDPNAGLPQLVVERNGSGTLVRRYRGGLDTVMMDTGGSPFFFHYDGLGSVVNLTDSTGVTQWTYAYLPYGAVRTETKNQNQAPANVLRFTGEVLDPIGLYQLRARSYDPITGRFISTDPAAAGPSDPYVSSYAYVNGNPIRYADPSGRCLQAIPARAAIGAGVGAGGAGVGALPGAGIGALAGAIAAAACAVATLVIADNLVRVVKSVKWPLEPTGTLQEPLFVNTGPPPPPQPKRDAFRCTTKLQIIVCITGAGLTYVYYNNEPQKNVPTPQPGPPPPLSPPQRPSGK